MTHGFDPCVLRLFLGASVVDQQEGTDKSSANLRESHFCFLPELTLAATVGPIMELAGCKRLIERQTTLP